MFEVYVDNPCTSKASTIPEQDEQKLKPTKLTIKPKARDGRAAGDEVTLAPKLNFESFAGVKAQIEDLVRCLPGFEEDGWSLLSLQFCDDDGDLVDVLPSTYDPADFRELPPGQRVYLRATMVPAPGGGIGGGGGSSSSSAHGTVRAKKGAPPPRRSALGRRDENTLPCATPRIAGREGGAWGKAIKATPIRKVATAAAPAATPRIAGSRAPRLPPATSQRSRAPTAVSTPSSGRSMSCRRPRAPAYVFKARGGADAGGGSSSKGSRDGMASKPPLPGRTRRAPAGGGNKPGWNSGNEPAWEEAERKKAIMRKEARARILGKRAAAAAMQASRAGGGRGAAARGAKARVFRRAKRDCLVTDARRQMLGAYIFCDPIGAPPPSLGKRSLQTYRELGRASAAQMKYLPVPDSDSAPKRGRGEARGEGGRAFVVYPRGDASLGAVGASARAQAPPKVTAIDKRLVVVASNIAAAAAAASAKKKGGAARSPSALPAAFRPPSARPGDIGFFRGGVGFRMRPPPQPPQPTPAKSAAAGATSSAAATQAAAATPTTRGGRDGRGGGGGGAAAGQGAAALTAAAAAKVRTRSCAASIRGSARQRGGGAVAAYKEAKGSKAAREDAAAAAAIMAKLAGGSRGKGRGGSGAAGGGEGEDVESLQEQVALLKAAAGLSDEELTWRMETAKPEANAYRIASAALERAETTYERLLWRQGQLQIARARLTGRGVGGDEATAAFSAAVSRMAGARAEGALRQDESNRSLSRLGSASEAVLAALPEPPAGTAAAAAAKPADAAATAVRTAASALAKLAAAVLATAGTGSEVDYAAVREEVAAEARALRERADGVERDLAALGRRVEAAVGQMEAWQQRKAEAPEFAAEEAAREEAWNEANREANEAALREMRALLPEAVWEMNAGDIQAAAATAARGGDGGAAAAKGVEPAMADGGSSEGDGGVFYPSDLCVRLRECRPLHWLMSAAEDIAGANFLAGEGAAAFTQLEGMDVVEMRAVWSVLPREFSRDADGKKAEWRTRFRVQLEGLARQQERAVVTAGWDPVRGRRATTRMPPLPAHRARHPAYFYPTAEAMESRVARLREQHRRLAARRERLSALERELAEAKAEVDSACADARSAELRKSYGADTLRRAREAAKEAHTALVREKRSLVAGVAEAERMLSSAYPSLGQLESEAESIAQLRSRAAAAGATTPDGPEVALRVPGAFSENPELRRRAVAAAKKLTPEEERRLRASEVRRAVGSRDSAEPLEGSSATATAAAADTGGGATDESCSPDATEAASSPPQKDGQGVAADAGPRAGERPPALVAPEPESTTNPLPEGRFDDGAPPPRRPVKIAPGVLALLTKQHRARAATAAVGGGGAAKKADLGTGGAAATPASFATSAAAAASGPSALRVPAIPPVPGAVPPPPPPPPQAPAARPFKPISKSLAALLARKAEGPPLEPGSGGVAGRNMASPSLGFLGELKARAMEKSGGVPAPPPSPRPPALAAGPAGGGGDRKGVPPLARGASFLDELKARTTRLS